MISALIIVATLVHIGVGAFYVRTRLADATRLTRAAFTGKSVVFALLAAHMAREHGASCDPSAWLLLAYAGLSVGAWLGSPLPDGAPHMNGIGRLAARSKRR